MLVLAALYPLILWGMIDAFANANNNIHQWLPQDFEETRTYEAFCRVFGTDDFVLASWDGCTLEDPRLEQFASEVVPPAGSQREKGEAKWFRKVWTGPQVLEILTTEPFNLSWNEAVKRLEGSLIGRDRETTCALITLSQAGDTKRTKALAALQRIAKRCKIDPDTLRLGGDATINAAIDIESERAIQQWIVLSWIVALTVAWFCLRSIKLMAMLFIVSGYASALGTAMISYTGNTMNLVLVVMPVLLYVLTLSAAVHLCNYYRDGIRESGLEGAPARAVRAGWAPCALSAITTALGLISLYVSQIIPVKLFGLYSALGIILGVGVLFLLLPAALEKWPLRTALLPQKDSPERSELMLHRMSAWTIRRRRPLMAVCLVSLSIFAVGAAMVNTTISPGRFFAPGSKWVKDSNWLQEHIGPMIPIEVVVRFEESCPLDLLERLELVRDVESRLHDFDEIGGSISAATFGPAKSDLDSSFRRSVAKVQLTRNKSDLETMGYLSDQGDHELWRISARVRAFSNIDHDRFLSKVKTEIDAFLEKRSEAPGTVRAIYTGVVPLVYLAQRELLDGLFKSFCLAFVMIGVVMTLLLRSLRAGLLVMLPNVFPAVITFGAMGWTGTLIDVGAMMTASVALGIAVDDTLHFLTWFRRALREDRSRHEAIGEAYRRCAPAMIQTTLIAGLGLLVFWLSSFQPVSQFGLLMFILLAAALVGDLVLLPAMLATRLGRLFERGMDDVV